MKPSEAETSPNRAEAAGPAGRLFRLWGGSLFAAVLFAVAAYWPAQWFGGDAGLLAMLAGTAVALLGALAAAVPPALLAGGPAKALAGGILANLGIRFLLTLFIAMGLWSMPIASRNEFLIWVAIAQSGLLIFDMTTLTRLARRTSAEATGATC